MRWEMKVRLFYLRLCWFFISLKFYLILEVYFPAKKLLRAVGFMLTLRIKEKVPLRIGWLVATDIIRKVDANEL